MVSCQRAGRQSSSIIADRVDDIAFAVCPVNNFDSLDRSDKLLAYYLYLTAVSGDPIAYKQVHPQGYRVKIIVDEILSNSMGIKEELRLGVEMYAKAFWANTGFYERASGVKFIPPVPRRPFQETVVIALSNGARLGFTDLRRLDHLFDELEPYMFHPGYQTYLVPPNRDILLYSPVNFYRNLPLHAAESFEERYPLNSRLVSEGSMFEEGIYTGGDIQEQVYRCGRDTIPPGLYAGEIAAMVDNIRLALPYAEGVFAKALSELIDYFERGEPGAFDRFQRYWVESDNRSEAYLGFVEDGLDPRRVKGAYQALVYCRNPAGQSLLDKILWHHTEIAENLPPSLPEGLDSVRIRLVSADLISSAGDVGWRQPITLTVSAHTPEDSITTVKTALFTNIASIRGRVLREAYYEYLNDKDKTSSDKYGTEADCVLAALVAYSASKPIHTPPNSLEFCRSLLEAIRVKTEALWIIHDNRNVDRGIISGMEAAVEAYRSFLRAAASGIAWTTAVGQHPDEQRLADALILQYILENSDAVKILTVRGRKAYKLLESSEMRQAVGDMLVEIVSIMNNGAQLEAQDFLRRYGIHKIVPEINAMSTLDRRINLTPFISVLVPHLELKTTRMGKIIGVELVHPADALERALMQAKIVRRQVPANVIE